MEQYPLSNLFIKQASKYIKKKSEPDKIIQIGTQIVIQPLTEWNQDDHLTIVIKDLNKLEENLRAYYLSLHSISIPFTEIDERRNMKFHFTFLWKNATNSDFANPEELVRRTFINDQTFSSYSEPTFIGYLENDKVYAEKKGCPKGYETPYEMVFQIVNEQQETAYLPVIRYGIDENNGTKKAFIYTIQHEFYEDNAFNKIIDQKYRKINKAISGMSNRGVHSPNFIQAITLFLGMLKKEGIDEILVNDFQPKRWTSFYFANNFSLEERENIQSTITNKLLKTHIRIHQELSFIKITSYPNEIDNFLHLKIEDIIPTIRTPLLETFLLGYSNTPNIKEKTLN